MHVFVSGRISLDLAGTLKWRRDEPEELLPDGPSAAGWIVEAQLLTQPPRLDGADAEAVRRLRELVYAAVRVDAPRRVATAELQALADPPPVRSVLTAEGALERQGDLVAVLSTVARDAIELIGSAELDRVRECGRPECTRLFVDHSRGKPRRWCGMAECGNRVKAANYRRRQRLAEQA
ncbi:CGNR zinc finger domain-containing protein [Amycolatopsis cynarae]|uniref:CGNR zinc finger domain-containing protein n=1 Tax=Amycolatopsis cynarae TaxID=2995223 RepID=A0ABY7B733_9PSEU|nr:CGNR zinc finger domain-containing protein [Amycolatopsis sp. HUAS 11-8]WAL68147.1 CGNR zinc finger domain-containing protein [Amycolatopsis sp. HUAS 11-8]